MFGDLRGSWWFIFDNIGIQNAPDGLKRILGIAQVRAREAHPGQVGPQRVSKEPKMEARWPQGRPKRTMTWESQGRLGALIAVSRFDWPSWGSLFERLGLSWFSWGQLRSSWGRLGLS